MLYMLINRTRSGLDPDQFAELARRATEFYASPPAGIVLRGDWSARDGSRSFALVEVETAEALERVQAPFREFVDIESVAVEAVSGWRAT